jgi:hypothetical protein
LSFDFERFVSERILLAGLGLATVLTFGCQTLTSGAPAVSPPMVRSANQQGFSREQVAAGRKLLVTRCISCHSLVPVGKYPAKRWPELVASMSARAGLDEIERALVTAYLVAARQSLP